ncbi:hypothetical protein LF1_14530 [Rubripirellula obstinata]|uniref:TIR domain-containing protein n=1 Tax=Rubripirellula obstinata TaxID=406547 RepID=A0A5B1CGQ4_9BACT|nr:toll/interleukin-1 receptor domain-containing protein [Rubripirellula obstinata]KAA1258929.1 hypothetical protein LF1_14530 [Rubripirellula obstinata]
MQVFLSWSKDQSRAAALAFRYWLPDVLQSVKPWMSDEDIGAGSGWNQGIRNALQASNFGILFVTRENHDKPWLMFEAGALAKHVDNDARVVPVIVDKGLALEALPGPIGQLQACRNTREEILKIVRDLNRLCDKPLDSEQLTRCFDAHWPRLEEDFEKLPEPEGEAPDVDQGDLLRKMYAMLQGVQNKSTHRSMASVGYDGFRNRGVGTTPDLSVGVTNYANFRASLSQLVERLSLTSNDETAIRMICEHHAGKLVDDKIVSLRLSCGTCDLVLRPNGWLEEV